MNRNKGSNRPLSLAEMPVIPIGEKPVDPYQQNPIALKRTNRKAVEKRRLEDEKIKQKHWQELMYVLVIFLALFLVAVALKHRFSEIMDFWKSIDLTSENILSQAWETICFFFKSF